MATRSYAALSVVAIGCAHGARRPPSVEPIPLEQLTGALTVSEPLAMADGGVVYVSDSTGSPELWWRDAAGSSAVVTTLNAVVDCPTASAASGQVVFAADGGGDEIYDLWSVAPGGKPTRLTKTTQISESSPVFSPSGDRLAVLADPGTPFQPQLSLFDLTAHTLTALTSGPEPVATPVWSPDGRHLAVLRSADGSHGVLVVVDLDGAAATATHVVAPPEGGELFSPLAFSPDSASVLGTTLNAAGFAQLALVPTVGGVPVRFGPADWDVEAAVWSPAAGIVFTQNVAGQSGLFRMATPSSEPEALAAPLGVIGSLTLGPLPGGDGEAVLFDRTDSAMPPALWRLGLSSGDLDPLTDAADLGLVPGAPFTTTAKDGRPLTGFVYVPAAGVGPFPAVVFVHGGPDGQSRDRFDADRQALAQSGFVVIDVNFRGSTGFGRAFADLDNGDWGGGDRHDLRAAVELFVQRGLVDGRRVGIMGGSFGGYMTLLALALDADLYRAGVDLYGMPDLTADFEMTRDRYEAWYRTEMGTPTERPDLFRDRSPLTHLQTLTAPLLVLHGANDTDVPRRQSDALVVALQARSRPVEYVVYPGEGHGFSKRATRLDVIRRATAFFRQHLR